jgi:hypothetical protein
LLDCAAKPFFMVILFILSSDCFRIESPWTSFFNMICMSQF